METNKKLPISKLIINFLIGLILGLSISTFAWVNPDQNPPLGGGVIRTDTSGLKIVTTTQITSGNLIITSGNLGIGILPGARLTVVLPRLLVLMLLEVGLSMLLYQWLIVM